MQASGRSRKVSSRLVAVTGTTAKDVKAAAAEEAKRRKEELKQAWKERKKQMDEQRRRCTRGSTPGPSCSSKPPSTWGRAAKAAAHDKFDEPESTALGRRTREGWGCGANPKSRHRDRAPRSILCAATRARAGCQDHRFGAGAGGMRKKLCWVMTKSAIQHWPNWAGRLLSKC